MSRPDTAHSIERPSQTPATDHVRAEDNNLVFILGEWGFKALFLFLGATASLLSLLAPRPRDGA